jgi:hypothetical protein
MSVLDDFARIRLYRERASEFKLLAETEALDNVRLRFRILAHREEQADKARMADRLARLRRQRQQRQHSQFCQGRPRLNFSLKRLNEVQAFRCVI